MNNKIFVVLVIVFVGGIAFVVRSRTLARRRGADKVTPAPAATPNAAAKAEHARFECNDACGSASLKCQTRCEIGDQPCSTRCENVKQSCSKRCP